MTLLAQLSPAILEGLVGAMKDGSQTSEGKLVALAVALLAAGAIAAGTGELVVDWWWPVSLAVIVASYCLSRGMVKAQAAEVASSAAAEAASRAAVASAPGSTPRSMGAAAVVLLLAGLALSACAPAERLPAEVTSSPRYTMAQACQLYAGAIETVAAAIDGDLLSPGQVDAVEAIEAETRALCLPPDPLAPAEAVEAVRRSAARLVHLSSGVRP